MMRHCYTILCISALLLLAACGGRYERMRQQLDSLQALNQSDSLLTDDSLALALTQYFDRHGSPNERMQAHYLLARTYADMGQAPQALDEFHTAAECADTTSAECDYAQLCRVYSQMSTVFYRQYLIDEHLMYLDKAIKCANMASDSFAIINLEAQKIASYSVLANPDSVLSVYEKIYYEYCAIGLDTIAARYSSAPIKSYLIKGDTAKARLSIEVYESRSGYFDASHDIAKGREYYYNQKGHYFLTVHKYDSAEYYFRKELSVGKDYYNQYAASNGLSTIFQLTKKVDSVAKYALYSTTMLDSVYKQKVADAVVNAQGLYNYTDYQRLATQAKERAENEKRKTKILYGIIVGLIVISSVIVNWWNKKRRKMQKAYQQKLNELVQAQSEILQLRSHEEVFCHLMINQKDRIDVQESREIEDLENQKREMENLIKKKESMIENLWLQLDGYRKKENMLKQNAEDVLAKSPIYMNLLAKANKGITLSEKEWQEIHQLVIEVLPNFYSLISSKKSDLNEKQYRVCTLLRLKISPLCISLLMGIHASYVTKLSRLSSVKLFNCSINSLQLAEKLQDYS